MKTQLKLLSTVAILSGFAAFVHAATIVPVSYVYNTTIDNQPGAETNPVSLLIDGEVGEGSWSGGDYVGFGDAGANAWASVTFAFDAVYDFDTIDIYQYSTFNAGLADISTSTDGTNFTSPTQFTLNRTVVGGTKTSVRDLLDVTSLANAQYVRIDYFKGAGAGNWVFLSETSFSAVPEPSSFALLAGMFGLTWIMLRRRV